MGKKAFFLGLFDKVANRYVRENILYFSCLKYASAVVISRKRF